MKKFTLAFAALVALAIPAAASANTVGCADLGPVCGLTQTSDWNGGWGGTPHDDNAASPSYWTHFGGSGSGNSHYCLNPNDIALPGVPPSPPYPSEDSDCDTTDGDTTVDVGTQFAGYLDIVGVTCQGCSHGTPTANNGAIYVMPVSGVDVGFQHPIP